MSLIPSATVALIRQNKDTEQIKILLLQKNNKISYGGSWVFPGGQISDIDRKYNDQSASGHSSDANELEAARLAAVRETFEETGLDITPETLLPYAHWTTPSLAKKRYSTWFFICDISHLEKHISIDNGEITAYQWRPVHQALDDHQEKTIRLNNPGFVTLNELKNYIDCQSAINYYRQRGLVRYNPKAFIIEDEILILLDQDNAYHAAENDIKHTDQSPLHRIYMYQEKPWQYLCDLG